MQFKILTLSGLESTFSASVNTPHKGDSFHGNRNVKKKKKPWKHLLPTSFPSAPCTVVCQAWKLHLRQESLLSIDLAINYRSHYQLLAIFSHQLKQFSCEVGVFSLLPLAGPF